MRTSTLSAAALAAAIMCAACSDKPANAPSNAGGVRPEVEVDFRRHGWTGPVLNQGYVGSCTAFGITAVMNSLLRHGGRREDVSAMHVWAELKLHHGLWDDVLNVGIAPEEAWHYDPVKACLIAAPGDECAQAGLQPGSGQLDPAINAEWIRANVASRHRVTFAESVYQKGGSTEAVFAALARGEALLSGIAVDGPFGSFEGDVIPDYAVTENAGGHSIALVGYRIIGGQRQVLVQNSWGPDWGDGGFAWLPESMFATHLSGVERLVMGDGTMLPPAAVGQCQRGQLDQVLDACYASCRNGLRTLNGRCNPMPASPLLPTVCQDLRDIFSGGCKPAAIPGAPALPIPGLSLPTMLQGILSASR